jgi:hypothetical protein
VHQAFCSMDLVRLGAWFQASSLSMDFRIQVDCERQLAPLVSFFSHFFHNPLTRQAELYSSGKG